MPSWHDFITKAFRAPAGASSRPVDGGMMASITGATGHGSGANNADLAGGMGPGIPPNPQPLDGSGQPRQWQFRPGYNLPSVPGEGRMSFETLRALADLWDIGRKCIEARKDEVARLEWDIAPRAANVRDKRRLIAANQAKIDAARDFFQSPDKINTWQGWIRSCLEDYFVIDALTLYKRRTYGGQLYALEQIAGETIKPLLTLQGRTPLPPDPAYQQYLYGIARDDFTVDELMYRPKNKRPATPYGYSVLEQFATHVNLYLRWQVWNTALFTDGNIPAALLSAPPTWSADQIEEFMQLWDATVAGAPAKQRGLKMLPAGTTLVQGPADVLQYSRDFTNWLIDMTLVAFDMTRQELGLSPSNSEGLGGSGHAEAMTDVQRRRSLKPLCAWLSDSIFTPILRDEFGLKDFHWVWPDLDAQDPLEQAQIIQTRLYSGQVSLDDVLMEQGDEPVGVGRFVVAGNTVYFEPDLIKLSREGTLAQAPKAPPGAQGQQPPPDAADKPPDGDDEDAADREALKAAGLTRWERKAAKAVRTGKSALVPFSSDHIDAGTRALLTASLDKAFCVEDVRTAFKAVQAEA